MHKRTVGLMLTGILATGAVGAVAITPASATTSDNAVTSRLAGIKSALSGLVTDGTLTQTQADKVASTLNSKLSKQGRGGHSGHMGGSGPGGHMGGMGGPRGHLGGIGMTQIHAAAAKALGMTAVELSTAMQGGKSLKDIAKDQKVSVGALVKVMVASAEAQLAAAVKGGTMTQAQADAMTSSLTQRITDRVNGVRPERFRGNGPRGAEWSPPTGTTSGATSSTRSSAV